MGNLASLSDEELLKIAKGAAASNLSSLSDEQLARIASGSFVDEIGPAEAAVIAAGRTADKLKQGLKQMALTPAALFSDSAKKALSEQKADMAEKDRLYEPLRKAQPLATIGGETLPYLFLPIGRSLGSSVGMGALPALTEYGTPQEKLLGAGLGAAGGGVGYGIGKAIGNTISPAMKPESDKAAQLAQVAAKEGIPLDAAQVTGNPVLQNVKAALGTVPWTAGGQARSEAAKQAAYNAALLKRIGSNASAATPDVLADAHAGIVGNLAKASDKVQLVPDEIFVNRLANFEKSFLRRLPTDQKPVIGSYLQDLTNAIGGQIPGDAYATARSSLGQIAADSKNSTVSTAAKELQKTLDDLFDRQAPQAVVDSVHEARKQYGMYLDITKALKNGRITTGDIPPKQMYAAVENSMPGFARSEHPTAELVRAGRQFLPDPIPNSGTPQRALYANLLTAGSMGGLGALGSTLAGSDPKTGFLTGLAGFGLSKGAQKAINSPMLVDYLTNEAISEATKRRLARAGGLLGYGTATALPPYLTQQP